MGFFKNNRPRLEAGTKVTVYTVNNWKGDGTGGTPGEVMEVGSLDVHIMWENDVKEVAVDRFDPHTHRSRNAGLQAWFQLRDEPFAPAPELSLVDWSSGK